MENYVPGPGTDATSSAQAVKEIRAKLGLTQEAFAHAIAVTVSTVNRWENGHATPSRLAWRAIQELVKKHGEGRQTPFMAPPSHGF